QTQIRFVYTKEQLAGLPAVTIRVQKAAVESVLKTCFAGTAIIWSREGDIIVLRRNNNTNPAMQGISEKAVNGKVVDHFNQPLEGVTVRQTPSGRQTLTNKDGEYSMWLVEGNSIKYSYIGFESIETTLFHPATIMKPVTSLLDDAVVIAYGTTTRRLNTGSISTVKGVDIAKQPVNNPIAALQGRVAGLQISPANGLPGAGINVLIRGKNSIQNGVTPLIIIDGVPFLGTDERLMQLGAFNANNPFATINPKDIESIEVLKDADATAIYGSRGANGVILISTKKATRKESRLTLSLQHGFSKQANTLSYMNLPQYLAMRREAFMNDSILPTNANAPDLLLWEYEAAITVKRLYSQVNLQAGVVM
ncbi:MAG: SusC/RagA family TonB-linked outer membrane protein, partial [Sphingobacteriales bacterium]